MPNLRSWEKPLPPTLCLQGTNPTPQERRDESTAAIEQRRALLQWLFDFREIASGRRAWGNSSLWLQGSTQLDQLKMQRKEYGTVDLARSTRRAPAGAHGVTRLGKVYIEFFVHTAPLACDAGGRTLVGVISSIHEILSRLRRHKKLQAASSRWANAVQAQLKADSL